jgi:hypothetical protein
LDRGEHRRTLSFAIRAELGQADVIEFTSSSTVDWRALQTFILQDNATIFEEEIQFALAIGVEAIGNDSHVILAPLAILVQLASVALGIVELESDADFAVGMLADSDGVVAGRGLSINAKDAFRGALGYLTQDWKAIQDTDDAVQRPRASGYLSMVKHSDRLVNPAQFFTSGNLKPI